VKYDEAVAWLYASQLHGIKLGLENTVRLTEALSIRVSGPHAPKFLHVAGTNGKGSVVRAARFLLPGGGVAHGAVHLAAKKNPCLYFRERIRLDGEMIGEEDVATGLTKIRDLSAGWDRAPTFFEIATVLALAWFQEKGAAVVALETGMGGRLDATNVVTPAVCVLTRSIWIISNGWASRSSRSRGKRPGSSSPVCPSSPRPRQRKCAWFSRRLPPSVARRSTT